jgi:hypothetical protein
MAGKSASDTLWRLKPENPAGVIERAIFSRFLWWMTHPMMLGNIKEPYTKLGLAEPVKSSST